MPLNKFGLEEAWWRVKGAELCLRHIGLLRPIGVYAFAGCDLESPIGVVYSHPEVDGMWVM